MVPVRKVPHDRQVCLVEMYDGSQHYVVWSEDYSIYGSGGAFRFGDGSMAGIPIDVHRWWGTHWIAEEREGIACAGEMNAEVTA